MEASGGERADDAHDAQEQDGKQNGLKSGTVAIC